MNKEIEKLLDRAKDGERLSETEIDTLAEDFRRILKAGMDSDEVAPAANDPALRIWTYMQSNMKNVMALHRTGVGLVMLDYIDEQHKRRDKQLEEEEGK